MHWIIIWEYLSHDWAIHSHFLTNGENFPIQLIEIDIFCITIQKNYYWLQKHFFDHYYASPSSGEAYRDRRLTSNFELWVEIFCVPTCFHVRIPKPCLSVCLSVCLSICPYPEKRNPPSFVNISPKSVIDASMERSSEVLQHGNPKCEFHKIKVAKARKIS